MLASEADIDGHMLMCLCSIGTLHTQTYLHILYTLTYVKMHSYTCTHMRTDAQVHIFLHVCRSMCTCMCTRICERPCTVACMHAHLCGHSTFSSLSGWLHNSVRLSDRLRIILDRVVADRLLSLTWIGSAYLQNPRRSSAPNHPFQSSSDRLSLYT